MGGFGSAVIEWMSDHDYHPHVIRMISCMGFRQSVSTPLPLG